MGPRAPRALNCRQVRRSSREEAGPEHALGRLHDSPHEPTNTSRSLGCANSRGEPGAAQIALQGADAPRQSEQYQAPDTDNQTACAYAAIEGQPRASTPTPDGLRGERVRRSPKDALGGRRMIRSARWGSYDANGLLLGRGRARGTNIPAPGRLEPPRSPAAVEPSASREGAASGGKGHG
jgi:hypothetical protein